MDEIAQEIRDSIDAAGSPELAAYAERAWLEGTAPLAAGRSSEAAWQEYLAQAGALVDAEAGSVGLYVLMMLAARCAESPYLSPEVRAKFREAVEIANERLGRGTD